MLQKIDLGIDNIIGFRWEGKFDKEAFKQSMQEFLPELRTRDEMNIYLEFGGIEGMEAKAVWEDLKFYFSNMKELQEKINKIALVTNKDWFGTLSELSYKFVPGIKLKSFSVEDTEAAIAYLKE